MSDKELSFLAYDTTSRNAPFVGEFTNAVQNYHHEWLEGPDQGGFDLEEKMGSVSDTTLRGWFDRRLMWHIVTLDSDRPVFDGYIYSMDLERDGTHWRKSIEPMANAITCSYMGNDGFKVYIDEDIEGTPFEQIVWFEDAESIRLYGRREKVIDVNTESEDEAMQRAETELKYLSSPYAVPPTYRTTRTNRLTVTLVGRTRLANNVQLLGEYLRMTAAHKAQNDEDDRDDPTYAYGNETTVSAEILRIVEIVNEVSGWLYPLDIANTNGTKTLMGVPTTQGAWDRILELSKLRDANGNFYRLTVEPDGGVSYRIFSEVPDYYYKPEPSRIVYGDDTRVKWSARPGIIRVVDASIGPALPDTWLADRRNIYAERVSMRDGDEMASFHGREYDITDYLNSVEANKRRMERKREESRQ